MDASAAVMVFFCLSGYVIGLTYPEATTAPWVSSYLQRRAIRLLPVYFLGILLACAAATDLDPWNLVGHFLFLQNYCDYAGFWVLPMETNGNLWSLNYEVLYYLLFIPILAHRIPLGRVALLSGAVLLLAWYTAYLPLFLGCYAAGFLYWLAGLALAWRAPWSGPAKVNWLSLLLLSYVTWKVQGLRWALSSFPMPSFFGPAVRLYSLDYLPVALCLLAGVSRRDFPGHQIVRAAAVLIPIVGLVHQSRMGQGTELWIVYAVALIALPWKLSLTPFRWMAPVGAISYALYALGRPIQELVIRHSQSLPPNFFSYLLCTAVITVIAVMLSCYMDLRFYPQLRDWLRRRRKAGA